MAARHKIINSIKWEMPTIPQFHFATPARPRVYTLPDGGKFVVRQREWTWQFGYIYYVNIVAQSLITGRFPRRVFSERELMLFMGKLAVSAGKHGKAA